MRGSQKAKRVSWASDGNICQVRLFLSEDPPSQVGSVTQDHLQAKRTSQILQTSYVLQSTGLVPDDSLPPGFEEYSPANQLKNKLAHVLLAKWLCPPRFILNAAWQVVAGEESREMEIQNQREMRVLEAIYPRPSAIPPNAADALDTENPLLDDGATPSIPITPIEEEDAMEDVPPGYAPLASASVSSLASEASHGTLPSGQSSTPQPLGPLENGRLAAGMAVNGQVNHGADTASAASDALAALIRSNEPGNLIDHDLLVKILGNPKVLDGLVKHQGANSIFQNVPLSLEPSQMASQQLPTTIPLGGPTPFLFNKMETSSSSSVVTSNGPFHSPFVLHHNPNPPPLGGVAQVPYAHSGSASPAKDSNYYKSLIQQHGGDKQPETLPSISGAYNKLPGPSRDSMMSSRPKFMKPCTYFNSSKGCRHGTNCVYQHDVSVQQRFESIPEMQSTKKTKMDRGMDIGGPQSYC
ncbi:hypothetical protein Dimus_004590 [Dionaea muscipula]